MRRMGKVLLWAACAAMPLGAGLTGPAVWGGEPREPGLSELVILDPGGNDLGLPPVETRLGPDGVEIDIPPIVHVHRNYYSGNKEYQGPIIDGGPTVVVANNPHTGKRMYIDVMLPGGAPVIAYDKHAITYVYPNRRVAICFDPLIHDKAVVKYLSGQGIARSLHDKSEFVADATHRAYRQSRLVGASQELARETGKAALGVVAIAGGAATAAVETTTKVVRLIPGVQLLQSLGEQAPERCAEEETRRISDERLREFDRYRATVR